LFGKRLNSVVVGLGLGFGLGLDVSVENGNSSDGVSGLRDEVGPADGAGGVRGEPLVDALGVEHVIALGDQTQRFGVLELV